MSLPEWRTSSGLLYRRLAPALVSLFVLAAMGIAGRGPGWSRPRLLGLLLPLFVLGAVGWTATISAEAARRLPHRGECYEWFGPQLMSAAGGDLVATLRLIERVDRGDARFGNLRFRLPVQDPPVDDPLLLQTEKGLRQALSEADALYRVTLLGRRLSRDPARLVSLPPDLRLDDLSAVGRRAFFHGLGLGLEPPRPNVWAREGEPFVGFLTELARRWDPDDAEAFFEGYGFARGFGYDPYNEGLASVVSALGALPTRATEAAARGLGWGYRQRYTDPPEEVPAGLAILDSVPADARDAFVDGYLARVLPAEAAILTAG